MKELGIPIQAYIVAYQDFENLIKEVYGREYNFPYNEYTGNDVVRTYQINPKYMTDFDKAEIDAFIKTGEGSYLAGSLLDDLCVKEIIPAGYYVIEVSW
jgi:hypothetical protein